eukprot:6473520-Pyramimonas_sp.AAC.1
MVRRRRALYDRRGPDDPAKAFRFRQLLAQLPPVAFNVDSTSHCFIRQSQIQGAAVQAFPKPERAK